MSKDQSICDRFISGTLLNRPSVHNGQFERLLVSWHHMVHSVASHGPPLNHIKSRCISRDLQLIIKHVNFLQQLLNNTLLVNIKHVSVKLVKKCVSCWSVVQIWFEPGVRLTHFVCVRVHNFPRIEFLSNFTHIPYGKISDEFKTELSSKSIYFTKMRLCIAEKLADQKDRHIFLSCTHNNKDGAKFEHSVHWV